MILFWALSEARANAAAELDMAVKDMDFRIEGMGWHTWGTE